MGKLNNKQLALLSYLRKYITDHGEAPTLEEISIHYCISVPAAQMRLRTLSMEGVITRVPNKPRAIKINENPRSMSVSLPVLGTISAGYGVSVFEEPDPEMVEVPPSMIHTSYVHYCLRIDGNSMAGDGIVNGDIVVVRQQQTADNGNIVVAIIHDDPNEMANLKRFYKFGNEVELRASNPNFPYRKRFRAEQVEIRGKFCGLIRSHEI